MKRLLKHKTLKLIVVAMMLSVLAFSIVPIQSAYAGTLCGAGNDPTASPKPPAPYAVKTSIDLGCQNTGNPVMDLLFAIIRILSAGVGIIVIASIIVGGIQFAASRSDPQASASAIGRIRTSLIALIIYIFAYAILNFVIPGGFFT